MENNKIILNKPDTLDPDKKPIKFGYIDREFFEGIFLEESGFDDDFDNAVFTASETINVGCGNNIERIGFDNLSELQQRAVKKATARLVQRYLQTGEVDVPIGSASLSAGGMSFAMSTNTDPTMLRYIPPEIVGILEQAGLLDHVVGINPMKHQEKDEPKEGYKYRRWGLGAMDDSIFISDGTTDDGNGVRLKITDKYQEHIRKSEVIDKYGNHLVYRNIYHYED